MRRGLVIVGLTLVIAGLTPILLPLLSSVVAARIDGCAANEAGAVDCIIGYRDIGPLLAAPFRLLPFVPIAFLVALAGFGLLIAGWSAKRAATRRAKHR